MSKQQASNRTTPAPDFLTEAFERLKLVSPDIELSPLDEARSHLQDWLLSQRPPKRKTKAQRARIAARRVQAIVEGKEFDSAPAEVLEAKEIAESVLGALPRGFRDYLWSKAQGAPQAYRLLGVITEYENFRWLRQTLKWIARTAHQLSSIPPGQAPRFRLEEATVSVPAAMSIGADGRLISELHPFYKGLDEIEATRIRECQKPRCKQLFWAGRIDQVGCSPACSQAIRDHRYYIAIGKQRRRSRKVPTAAVKAAKLRQALAGGRALTREQISRRTKLSLAEVSNAIGEMNKDEDQVKSKTNRNGEWAFYLVDDAKKGN